MIESVPHVDGWVFAGLVALSMFTAAFGVVAGLGGGVMLLGVMAIIFPPAAVIPLHGTIQLGANVSRTWQMRRDIIAGPLPAFGLGAILGAALGGSVVVALPAAVLQGILGAFLLYVCWVPRLAAAPPSQRRFAVLGFFGALTTMFVGATGTLLAPFIAGMTPDRRIYVATLAAMMVLVHGLKVVAFVVLGFAFVEYLPLILAMIASGYLGVRIGREVLDRMPEALFRRIFQIVLTLLALRLLYAAATGI